MQGFPCSKANTARSGKFPSKGEENGAGAKDQNRGINS
jgi:hypothetical protein